MHVILIAMFYFFITFGLKHFLNIFEIYFKIVNACIELTRLKSIQFHLYLLNDIFVKINKSIQVHHVSFFYDNFITEQTFIEFTIIFLFFKEILISTKVFSKQ